MFIAYAFLAAILFTSGAVFMKSAEGLTKIWPSVLCMVCFMGGAALQALAMRGNQMGVTHIFVLGLEAALALAFGAYFFSEPMSLTKLAGALLVFIGIVLLRQA